MKKKALVSLIIPTRERAHLLRESLKTATQIKDDRIEIVVSDNASCDRTEAEVRSNSDSRIRYVNTGKRISMRQNFEYALTHSRGEYVIFIGDDDGFLPRQFPHLRAALDTFDHPVIAWNPVRYIWPHPQVLHKSHSIRIRSQSLYGRTRVESTDTWRRDLLAGRNPYPDALPSIYHGCVARSLLESWHSRFGFYFGASAPDLFSSYCIALEQPSYVRLNHAITVNGQSAMSTGAAQASHKRNQTSQTPATVFLTETAPDPVRDAVVHSCPSLPMTLFSAFESVRVALNLPTSRADFLGWYGYVLSQGDGREAATFQALVETLTVHANRFASAPQLKQALARGSFVPRKRRSPLHSLLRSLTTIRTSGRCQDTDTVFTAALAIDHVLGDFAAANHRSTAGRTAAWLQAKMRSLRSITA
jgi:hypothetical protein